jgi:hypothetical protein
MARFLSPSSLGIKRCYPYLLADAIVSEKGMACSAAKLPHNQATSTCFRTAAKLVPLEILSKHGNLRVS